MEKTSCPDFTGFIFATAILIAVCILIHSGMKLLGNEVVTRETVKVGQVAYKASLLKNGSVLFDSGVASMYIQRSGKDGQIWTMARGRGIGGFREATMQEKELYEHFHGKS